MIGTHRVQLHTIDTVLLVSSSRLLLHTRYIQRHLPKLIPIVEPFLPLVHVCGRRGVLACGEGVVVMVVVVYVVGMSPRLSYSLQHQSVS